MAFDPTELAPTLIDNLARGAAILACVWLAMFALRHAAAALRHFVWVATFAVLLLLAVVADRAPVWSLDAIETSAGAPLTPPAAAPIVTRVAVPSPAADVVRSIWGGLAWVWAGVFLWLSLRTLFRLIGTVWMIHRGRSLEAWLPHAARIATSLGVHRRVRVVANDRVRVPFVHDIGITALILPAGAGSWSEERRELVLRHELAHVRRRDHLTMLVARIAVAVHWLNPLVWIALRRLEREQELACDDVVLAGEVRASRYASHLVDIAAALPGGCRPAMAASGIEQRVLALLDPATRRGAPSRRSRVLATIGLAAIALPIAGTAVVEAGAGSRPRRVVVDSGQRPLRHWIARLRHPAVQTRIDAAHALGDYRDPRAAPALVTALRDADVAVRLEAAWALGEVRAPYAIDALLGCAADPSEPLEIRRYAIRALGETRARAAAPFLIRTLSSPVAGLRSQAADALGDIGAVEAVAALEPLCSDPDLSTRRNARAALRKILD